MIRNNDSRKKGLIISENYFPPSVSVVALSAWVRVTQFAWNTGRQNGRRGCMRADRSFLETGHNPLDVAPTPPRQACVLYSVDRLERGSRAASSCAASSPLLQLDEKFYSAGLAVVKREKIDGRRGRWFPSMIRERFEEAREIFEADYLERIIILENLERYYFSNYREII